MSDIKLYGYSTSPFVRKTGCCLYYKQVPFEFVPVNPVFNKEIEFTEQRQVPVLKIADDWRLDSTEHAKWLDEIYPENPLLGRNEMEREIILGLDEWITDNIIHSGFRSIHDKRTSSSDSSQFKHTAWRLAAIISSQTPLDEEVRNAWPKILMAAPFIKRIAEESEDQEKEIGKPQDPYSFMKEHLSKGPFLGGMDNLSLADLSAYQSFLFNYAVGITDELKVKREPEIYEWMLRVKEQLPENPLLVPDYIWVNDY